MSDARDEDARRTSRVRPSGAQTWPEELLHHEASDPRARVEHGEDEEGLEHDGEVVPDAEQALAADACR